jgi:hypothetical protein
VKPDLLVRPMMEWPPTDEMRLSFGNILRESMRVIDIAAQSAIYYRHGLEGRFIVPSGHSTRGEKWKLDTPPIF